MLWTQESHWVNLIMLGMSLYCKVIVWQGLVDYCIHSQLTTVSLTKITVNTQLPKFCSQVQALVLRSAPVAEFIVCCTFVKKSLACS